MDQIGWDEYVEKLVAANSPERAREIANENTGDEGKIWTDATMVTCEELKLPSDEGAIIESFNAG